MCKILGSIASFWPWRSFLYQQLWATLMDDTPSLVVFIGLWRSQSLQNDYWVMAVRHGQFRPFHKVWLLRADCMKLDFKVRTNLAKTWQNMTQMLLNVALLRAHIHLLQGRNRWQSQNTVLHRSPNFLWYIYIYIQKIRSKCIQMWIQYHS